ncbi:hypothetical protein ACIBCN_20095 [Nocardia sp. NPDC051052]|uniref:hypothetical protein n=1 Tax=Nocardia sp. NPDC051052 TaxID=3364322 RepID=UPI003794CFBD
MIGIHGGDVLGDLPSAATDSGNPRHRFAGFDEQGRRRPHHRIGFLPLPAPTDSTCVPCSSIALIET